MVTTSSQDQRRRASRWRAYLLVALALAPLACERSDGDRWSEVAGAVRAFVEDERQAKGVPAVSVALVDEQGVVWSASYGEADPELGIAADEDTVYRVGSVSKLFTDLAVMQLVERGELDLDAPVSEVLPGFRPASAWPTPITLRQLMCHRSGLVREPPIGHYFDDSGPSLAATVASLGQTSLVLEPGTATKYSNAGIAVVGRVLEVATGSPFAKQVRTAVLDPLGMESSDFVPSARVAGDLAKAFLWTYDGRRFEAPTFELGMAPAGSLYASVDDLAAFVSALLNGGGGLIRPETLDEMLRPQFAGRASDERSGGEASGPRRGYGLGFRLSELEGRQRVGHGGAIYGFATELAFLPEDDLGVVVTATLDFANATVTRIADFALRAALAAEAGEPLPEPPRSAPVDAASADRLAGRYRHADGDTLELVSRRQPEGERELWLIGPRFRGRLRANPEPPTLASPTAETSGGADAARLIVDDRHTYGTTVEELDGGRIAVDAGDGAGVFVEVDSPLPPPPPRRWRGLIGEYGWDHNVLYVYERDGRLHALVEWLEDNPLTEIDENTFAFPEAGALYHHELLSFERGPGGRASTAKLGEVPFPRRAVGPESGETFRIDPVRPVDELRRAALDAEPPTEEGTFRASDLVELTALDPTIRLDVRYATTNNFMSTVFYLEPRAFLQRPAAEAVARVNRSLHGAGYGLLIHDAYRPWFVTKMFWDATPEEQKVFVANPENGSRHNRGAAVDLTLFELATGEPVEMVGGYDEFSARSYPDYPGGTSRQRWHRELLRSAMEAEGFTVYEAEWWHFDHPDWPHYAIQNHTFEGLRTASSAVEAGPQ